MSWVCAEKCEECGSEKIAELEEGEYRCSRCGANCSEWDPGKVVARGDDA